MCNLITKTEDCHEFKANVYYIAGVCLNNNSNRKKKDNNGARDDE